MQLQGILPQGSCLAVESPGTAGKQFKTPAELFGEKSVTPTGQSISKYIQLLLVGGEFQQCPATTVKLVFKMLGFI